MTENRTRYHIPMGGAEPIVMDGKALAEDIYKDLEKRIIELKKRGVTPGLGIISFGEESGQVYVRNKIKTCERLGIHCEHITFGEEDWNNEYGIFNEIDRLNNRRDIHGIIVQLPIPDEFNVDAHHIVNSIITQKDVDGLGIRNTGRLYTNNYPTHHPCTPKGIVRLLEEYGMDDLSGWHAVIVGRSELVGRPLAKMLLDKNATVTVCHSRTMNLKEITRTADILITATGQPEFFNLDYVSPDTVLIDVGIGRNENGKLVGDIRSDAYQNASMYTPVPGGVGPMTVAMLMENVVKSAECQPCYMQYCRFQ